MNQPGRPEPLREQIQFAVILNGGVSLAVWMGGVVRELDALTREKGPYGGLLGLVGSAARVDVIAGTSAGGINGAALALSQVNEDDRLGTLRDLWVDQGQLSDLLRQPFQGAPSSLLRGDEYFSPRLRSMFDGLVARYRARPPGERPIDLTITTTLLRGSPVRTVDDLGQQLWQTVHEGRFHFGYGTPGPDDATTRFDFAGDKVQDTVAALTLAARSTASFPMAFEPSFVPVDERRSAVARRDGTATERPDMGWSASWWGTEGGNRIDRSRFAVDGGVLVNTPTEAALAAVDRMPSEGPSRRIMMLVFPHAPGGAVDTPDDREKPPPLVETMQMISAARGSQSGRTHVEVIERHNRVCAARRGNRQDVLGTLLDSDDLAGTLRRDAAVLLPHYRQVRIRRTARDLADQVPKRPGWPYERVRRAAEQAQRDRLSGGEVLPDVPAAFDPAGDPAAGWPWGIVTVEHLATAVGDLLRRIVWRATTDDVRKLRVGLDRQREKLRNLQTELDGKWRAELQERREPPEPADWTRRLGEMYSALVDVGTPPVGPARGTRGVAARQPVGIRVRTVARVIARIACRAREPLLAIVPAPERPDPDGLRPWAALLDVPDGADAASVILGRLLDLEVLTECLAEEADTGAELPVELVQASLQTENAFATFTRTPDEKGAGLALARFSGFLKRSWRVNDWFWGRLDAATVLCRTVLSPSRLRRVVELDPSWDEVCRAARADQVAYAEGRAERIVREVVTLTFDARYTRSFAGLPSSSADRLTELRAAAVAELRAVYDPTVSIEALPPTAPRLADIAAWGIQQRIALEEVPVLANAVQEDAVDGANRRSRGVQFVACNEELVTAIGALHSAPAAAAPPEGVDRVRLGLRALEAFDRAGVGAEDLGDEGTSDQMISTAAAAVGVTATVVDGAGFGLPAARPVTRLLRGTAFLPYWAVIGLSRGGRIARSVATLAFAVGGVLAALSLFGVLSQSLAGPAAAIGAGALLGAFGYSALRTGTIVHGLVLVLPVVPLVVFAIERSRADVDAKQGVSVLLVLVAFAGGLMLLASIPGPVRSPLSAALFVLRRRKSAVLLVVLAVGAVLQREQVVAVATAGLALLAAHQDVVVAVMVVLVVVRVVTSVVTGWRFRVWKDWGADDRDWRTSTLAHPAVTASLWCIVYGLVSLGLAWLVVWTTPDGREHWQTAAIVTFGLAAAVLILVAPSYLPSRARRRLTAHYLSDKETKTYEYVRGAKPPELRSAAQAELLRRLIARGEAYRLLLRPAERALDPPGSNRRVEWVRYWLAWLRGQNPEVVRWNPPCRTLGLTGAGRSLAKQISKRPGIERPAEPQKAGATTGVVPPAS